MKLPWITLCPTGRGLFVSLTRIPANLKLLMIKPSIRQSPTSISGPFGLTRLASIELDDRPAKGNAVAREVTRLRRAVND